MENILIISPLSYLETLAELIGKLFNLDCTSLLVTLLSILFYSPSFNIESAIVFRDSLTLDSISLFSLIGVTKGDKVFCYLGLEAGNYSR